MASMRSKRSEPVFFWWIIVPVMVDLFTNEAITWSRWAILGFTIVYFMDYFRESHDDDRDKTILNERFAKGEINEVEHIRQKQVLKDEQENERESGARYFLGLVFIVIGGYYFLSNMLFIRMDIPWVPVLLISFGAFWIYRNRN